MTPITVSELPVALLRVREAQPMKRALFFVTGLAVGLCISLVATQGAGSTAVLNSSGAYIELLTLVPGEGSGQHSTIPGEVGIVAEGEVVL